MRIFVLLSQLSMNNRSRQPLTVAGSLRDDAVALQRCIFNVLPNKDKSGRAIVVWHTENFDGVFCSKESMVRSFGVF